MQLVHLSYGAPDSRFGDYAPLLLAMNTATGAIYTTSALSSTNVSFQFKLRHYPDTLYLAR